MANRGVKGKILIAGAIAMLGTGTIKIIDIATNSFAIDDEIVITNENVDMDKICSLLREDNFTDVSCGATDETVSIAKEICVGNTIENVVSAYMEADADYVVRLYRRYGDEIRK